MNGAETGPLAITGFLPWDASKLSHPFFRPAEISLSRYTYTHAARIHVQRTEELEENKKRNWVERE